MSALERVADTHNETGEGPLWHPEEERLYWVDIPPGHLYRYDPAADEHERVYETPDGNPLGGYTIEDDGSLLIFTDDGRVSHLEPGSDEAELVTQVDAATRFNDVIADPEGRVFAGTMPGEDELGDLYRFDTDGTAELVVEDVDIANGMGFTDDLETFYFTESEAHQIYTFDYDRATGELSNQETFLETPADDGVPDGMTVDSEGYVWSARWDGGRVVRYDTDADAVDEIPVPARKVSSVTFGGPEYTDLYLTTALSGGDRSEEGEGAGALFRYPDVGVEGVPEFRSGLTL
ncbi:SMP-30/gluconolactonase/LRE family protein [Halobacteria archaeon AArc-m2/3/4]|uniref:SMP-30/gluconolactonase/LRE family protein n=1 Tax=Natronoglomus mannanivorans TaxID=2979990 RepID=A0ABT2QK33_9EURY|nr:SMP-30/gluconolactonase/LRE family protein [Halobacteria archaeon AArc-m2/3/4]